MAQEGALSPPFQSMGYDDENLYSVTSTSSSEGSSQDEGWAEQAEEEEALLLPKATTSRTTATCLSTLSSATSMGIVCRVLRLELPMDADLYTFLGVEQEELIVTCQFLRGGLSGDDDQATDVASTGLPTSYRPSKGQVCWDQKLVAVAMEGPERNIASSSISSSGRRTPTPDASLHFMLWSSSSLLGHADFPISAAANKMRSMQRVVLRFTQGARASTKVFGYRRSCGVAAVSCHHQHTSPALPSDDGSLSMQTPSPKRAQESSLWRRSISEPAPMYDGWPCCTSSSPVTNAHASLLSSPESPSINHSSSSTSSYGWPEHATLVFELLYSSSSSSSSTTTTIPAPASNPIDEPTVLQRLQLALARPSDGVSLEEARLLWVHRHTVIPPSSRALVKLLRSLMISSALRQDILREQQQQEQQPRQLCLDKNDDQYLKAGETFFSCPVLDVLHLWREGKGNLPVIDAMKLLTGPFSHPSIRVLALETLRDISDEELGFFLLQLVQLLRYESVETTTTTTTSTAMPISTGQDPVTLATTAALPASKQTSIETSNLSLPPPSSPMPSSSSSFSSLPMNMTPLAHLLIQRACRSPNLHLGHALFWHLAVEMQHSRSPSGRVFEAMRFAFLYSLREANEPAYSSLCAQEVWFKRIARIQQRVLKAPGLRERKQVLLRSLLSEGGVSEAPFPVPFPVDPSMLVTRLDAATASVYGSTTYPALITFWSSKETEASSKETEASSKETGAPMTLKPPSFSPSLSVVPQEITEEEEEEEENENENESRQPPQHQHHHASTHIQREEQLDLMKNLPSPPIPTGTIPSSLFSRTLNCPFHALEITASSSSPFGTDNGSCGGRSDNCTYSSSSGKCSSSSGSSSSSSSSSSAYDDVKKALIFKCREDLRQDQLVLQLISLMDTLLKKDFGLDLCLTPYRVLATGAQEGLVEYIPNAHTIADILASAPSVCATGAAAPPDSGSCKQDPVGGNGSKILAFFREHHPWKKGGEEEEEERGLGVDPRVLNRYIRSCAGYCVMTHLLGIGDRHLHNMMLCPDGRFFHLDFGFIMGKDPKPTPLLGPFRLSASMVDGMGGKEHENFEKFKRLCVKAFNGLRRHASVVIGVVGLMVDAGLKDLGGGGGSSHGSALTSGGGGGEGGGGGGILGGGGANIGSTIGGSNGGGVMMMMMMGSSLNLSSSIKSTTTATATVATPAASPSPHHLEAARILNKMEGRFRLDLTDEEAEGHFVGLIHKAMGALAPQVIEVLHNLAVKTK